MLPRDDGHAAVGKRGGIAVMPRRHFRADGNGLYAPGHLHRDTMPAYCIANIEVHTPDIYDSYRRHTAGTLPKFGGRFLVRGGATEVAEGSWQPARLVVIEFPSMDDLQAWYRSPEYQAIVRGRREGARSEVVFVEGFTP
jgi:uncharacterized protein (DUF1330 family)